MVKEISLFDPDFKEKLLEHLKSSNVLLLGAPSIGKTHVLLEMFGKSFILSNFKELQSKESKLSDYNPLILDDFYVIYKEAEREDSKILQSLLSGRKVGLCIVTTPYRGEWLYKKVLSENKPSVILLTVSKEIANDKINKTYDIKKKEEYLNKSKWEYKFSPEIVDNDYATYVPFWYNSIIGNNFREYNSDLIVSSSKSIIGGFLQDIANEIKDRIMDKYNLQGFMPSLFIGTIFGVPVGLVLAIISTIMEKRLKEKKVADPFLVLLSLKPQDIETLSQHEKSHHKLQNMLSPPFGTIPL